MRVHRSLCFPLASHDPRLDWIRREFRLIVNESIRVALQHDLRSRKRLTQFAYAELSRTHNVYKQYIPSAFEIALGVLKVHRRRVRKGLNTSRPWVCRAFLKAENQSYSLDRSTGLLALAIRGRERVELQLVLSNWHRAILGDNSWRLGSLTLTHDKVVLVVSKAAPTPYSPRAALALDTNKESMDGISVTEETSTLVSLSFGGVSQVQSTHFRRTRKLARRMTQDRRVGKRLIARERRRERNRIMNRLHVVSKTVVATAKTTQAAIILEALTLTGIRSFNHRRNRELNFWPRGELHRQIEYKAALAGVPVIKVNPAWTSKTCPVCGARRRDRVGQDFVCSVCDWEMDRQHNAACNILLSALASNEALARGVRFHPGALRHDAVIPLYAVPALLGGPREEPSGVESMSNETSTESKADVLITSLCLAHASAPPLERRP